MSLSDIAADAKCNIKEGDIITSSYENLVNMDAVDSKLLKELRECWLVARLCLERIIEVWTAKQSLSDSLI